MKYSNQVVLKLNKGPFLNIGTTTTQNYETSPPSHQPTYQKSILHCLDTQKAQPHYTNADVAFARECYCVTNSYLQTLVWDVNSFCKKREKILFLNKIDLSYSLVVFFVLYPHLRPFRTIFTRLAPFWCSAAKTDFLLAVEQENSTNSLKMPQNSLRHGQLKNKKYNKAIRYTNFLKKHRTFFFSF